MAENFPIRQKRIAKHLHWNEENSSCNTKKFPWPKFRQKFKYSSFHITFIFELNTMKLFRTDKYIDNEIQEYFMPVFTQNF